GARMWPLKPGRTAFEQRLLRAALAADVPVLGICGGMQLLAVEAGGTLYQDIAHEVPSGLDHEQRHDPREPTHTAKIVPAGLLADAEAIRAMGARPLCVATALTVQTTRAARSFKAVDAALIGESMRALLEEEDVRAVKIGMVGDASNARAIRALLPQGVPVVVDPVLAASSGTPLFSGRPRELLELARGALLTPNLAEAEALLEGPA